MIVCDKLTKTFDGKAGIKDINLKFRPGVIYGIIGYNGAGKTTLLRCIEGLYYPTSGNVYHGEISTKQEKLFLPYRKRIAYLPSEEYLYPGLSCRENIELTVILRTGKKGIPDETAKLIKYFETEDFLDKPFRDCSSGMKKKIQIITSLVGEIDTIVWDEPNNGLDIISNIKIKNLLKHYKSMNATILLSCHVIEFLKDFIDYGILLRDGNVAEEGEAENIGSLEELFLRHIDKGLLEPL